MTHSDIQIQIDQTNRQIMSLEIGCDRLGVNGIKQINSLKAHARLLKRQQADVASLTDYMLGGALPA